MAGPPGRRQARPGGSRRVDRAGDRRRLHRRRTPGVESLRAASRRRRARRGDVVSDLTDSTLFKVLDGLSPVHGGVGRYPGVGRWTRHLDPQQLQPCVYGYHLARGKQVLNWLAPDLYVAEPCPDHQPVDDGHELVTCRVRLVRRLDRWDETTARLFAADCVEAALLGERMSGREPDERSWAAVDAARRFARGEIRSAALS